MLGVGVDGLLVEFLGAVQVLSMICKEIRVATEAVGILGMDLDGRLVHFFRSLQVPSLGGQEARIDGEWRGVFSFGSDCLPVNGPLDIVFG